MNIYRVSGDRAEAVPEREVSFERRIQKLFEANLERFMGLQFVSSEFSICGRRLDTLAFDPQKRAFVIVEYKRARTGKLMDQGLAYLNLLLANRADFLVEYNERRGTALGRSDIEWKRSRAALVSTGFTAGQIMAAAASRGLMELWQVGLYEGGLLALSRPSLEAFVRPRNSAEPPAPCPRPAFRSSGRGAFG